MEDYEPIVSFRSRIAVTDKINTFALPKDLRLHKENLLFVSE